MYPHVFYSRRLNPTFNFIPLTDKNFTQPINFLHILLYYPAQQNFSFFFGVVIQPRPVRTTNFVKSGEGDPTFISEFTNKSF